ncbi:hypothetical protein ABEB36_015023 [Hypothenemus hampei]|uniref:Cilia- and flagella-associated protein 126 n=1 Tax=Hypothenemus hampei TaxID=57062 RepID=A0ABD1E2J0_HYPHA
MSRHFYAFQFDQPYRPTYLCNWEVPKYYCSRPARKLGCTKIISNDRGQLLPGAPRISFNKEIANKLNGSSDKAAFMLRCKRIAKAAAKKVIKDKLEMEIDETKNEFELQLKKRPLKSYLAGITKDVQNICPIHDF